MGQVVLPDKNFTRSGKNGQCLGFVRDFMRQSNLVRSIGLDRVSASLNSNLNLTTHKSWEVMIFTIFSFSHTSLYF